MSFEVVITRFVAAWITFMAPFQSISCHNRFGSVYLPLLRLIYLTPQNMLQYTTITEQTAAIAEETAINVEVSVIIAEEMAIIAEEIAIIAEESTAIAGETATTAEQSSSLQLQNAIAIEMAALIHDRWCYLRRTHW